MNLLSRGRSLERQSPPLSGRSTPNSPNRDYLHKYHTVSNSFFFFFDFLLLFVNFFLIQDLDFFLCSNNR